MFLGFQLWWVDEDRIATTLCFSTDASVDKVEGVGPFLGSGLVDATIHPRTPALIAGARLDNMIQKILWNQRER